MAGVGCTHGPFAKGFGLFSEVRCIVGAPSGGTGGKPSRWAEAHVRKRPVKTPPAPMIQPMNRPSPPTPSVAQAPDTALDEGRYLAVLARDARFDGHFFTAVTSTGIYCRPVCAVRTPRRENCRFFVLAAQAENAGFRPCLRCRPELAPQALVWSVQDASGILVQQAERLGVSDRHLRRIFEAALGVSPLQYLQTRRLLTAKQLLTDTPMPVTQVALASGFASVRRFNAAFSGHYGLNPTQLRRSGTTAGAQPTSTLRPCGGAA